MLNFLRLFEEGEKGRENFIEMGGLELSKVLVLSLTGHILSEKCHLCFFPFRTSQKSSWPGAITGVVLHSKLFHHKHVFYNNY